MSKHSYLDKIKKETFYALGKVNKSKATVAFFESFNPKLKFTKIPEEAYTFRSYEGAKEGRNSHSLLKDLKIVEVFLETRKIYIIGIEEN